MSSSPLMVNISAQLNMRWGAKTAPASLSPAQPRKTLISQQVDKNSKTW